jgi:ribosomal protein S18 acetylase RimI-like enzyme
MENIPLSMIRANMANLPDLPLPTGYTMRLYRPGDELLWIDIVRSGERFINITDDKFQREFAQDMSSVVSGMYFLVEPGGREIGTTTIWPAKNLKGDGLDYGRVHWVAIHPDFQGRGLCKPMLSFIMKRIAKQYERSVLGTSSGRTIALKCYLDFGFLPDLTWERAHEGWSEVKSVLKHPVLEAMDL